MTTSTTDLPVLDDLTTADVRELACAHLGNQLKAASLKVRGWAIAQGLMAETAVRGPMSRAVWVAYAVAHRLGVERPTSTTPAAPAVPVGPVASRCRCAHLRIEHTGGERCKRSCGCLRFRRAG